MSGPRITVAHDLQHACCLKATTKMEKGDGRLVIEEVLSGTPCRCLCHSTLRHSIRLAPGEWTIVLQLRQPDGAIATVHEETLPVRSLRPGNQSE